jgi:hypothetical protein
VLRMNKQATPRNNSPKENGAKDPKALEVDRQPDEPMADALAHAVLRPTIEAAVTVRQYTKSTFGELSINVLVDDLAKQCALASDGTMKRGEAILTTQAHTLNAIFNYLARRAQTAEYMPQLETYLRLGLKAQNQCRATLDTLATMKNPSTVAFVRQANIAHGPQQVNNTPQPVPDEASRAREFENPPNKLLEQQHGERLDGGTVQATVGADSSLEAVGEVHRPANVER